MHDRKKSEAFVDELMGAVLDSRGVEGVLALARSFCGVGLAFFDHRDGDLFVDSGDDDFAERCRFYPLAEVLRLYRHWKVERGDVAGYLVADAAYSDASRLAAVASHVINALLLCKTQGVPHGAANAGGGDLLARLLAAKDGDAEGIAGLGKSLERLGVPFARGFFVAAVSVRSHNESLPLPANAFSSLCRRYRNILNGSQPRALGASADGGFAAAFFCERRESASFLLTNIETVTRRFLDDMGMGKNFSIRIGVGGDGQSVTDFGRSHREAVMAVKGAALLARDAVRCEWRDMGAEQLLALPQKKFFDDNALYKAAAELRLLQKTGKTPFFSTLVAIVRNHWNITATAASLSLHYNSMKYRYDKIGEILRLDMDDPRNRFELSMIVRAYLYAAPLDEFYALVNR